MIRIVIYAFPAIMNFAVGGAFFILAFLFRQAGHSGLVVTGIVAAWALVYSISSCFMGRIVTPGNAGRLIMAGALGVTLTSIGFLLLPGLVAQYCLMGLTGVAFALYCTPFQVFMKAIEPDSNAGVVRSTALYTASWSAGMATGPLVFGLFDWKAGFTLTALLGLSVAVCTWLMDRHYRGQKAVRHHAEAVMPANGADYSKMPDYAWLGWIIAGCGTMAVCLVRTLVPARSSDLGFSLADAGLVMAAVSYLQGLTALLLISGKYWMYKPLPMILAGVSGTVALLIFAFGTTVPVFFAGAVLYGIFSGCSYFYLVFHSLVHPVKSSRYVAVNETVVGVTSVLGPVVGGLIAGGWNIGGTFLLAALMIILMSLFAARIFQLGMKKHKKHI